MPRAGARALVHFWAGTREHKVGNGNVFGDLKTSRGKSAHLLTIDKPNAPLRPIVSSVVSPSYHFSKIIHGRLKSSLRLPKSRSHIRNIVEQIEDITIPEDHVLISLDATGLYINTLLWYIEYD